MSQNPFGLSTITPYLIVKDVRALLSFVETVFAATRRGEPKMREDGSVMHAEVTIGDSVVMMGETTESIGPMPATLYVYVDDCDATYAAALQAGASEVTPPAVYPHGDRYGGVKDSQGNIWWAVTHVGTPADD